MKNSINSLRRGDYDRKEIPSLAIPLYFALFIPVLVLITLWTTGKVAAIFTILVIGFPGAAVLFKVRRKKAGIPRKLQLLFLIYVYFLARTIAVFHIKNAR